MSIKNKFQFNNISLSFSISVLILLLLCFFLYFPNLSKPFWGHHEFNGVFYGTFVKNYHRYGLIDTKGAQITTAHETSKENWSLHTHHPSTYPLILYGWSKIVGVSEAGFRSLSVLFTFLGFFYWQWQNRQNFKKSISSLLASSLILTTPLVWYYGSLPVFEPLLMPIVLLGLITCQQKKYNLMWLFIFLAAILDWPGYWLGIWITIYFIWQKDYKKFIQTSVVLGLATLLIASHQWFATGHPFSEFLKIGSQRLQVTSQPFTSFDWVKLLISRTKAFFGFGVLGLSLLGLTVGWFGEYRKIIGLSLLIGLSHILVFRNITWYHDYMLYHLLPYFLIVVTIAIKSLIDRFGIKILTLVIGIWLLNLGSTMQFRQDLMAMTPHKVCVDFGNKVAESEKTLTFLGSQENLNICPPFIGFYGEKKFGLELDEK